MEKKVRSSLLTDYTCQECLNCVPRYERKGESGEVSFRCKLDETSDYRQIKLKRGDLLPACEQYIDDQMSFLYRKHW